MKGVHRAVRHDAAPVERALHLIDLERDPRGVGERLELGPGCGAHVDRPVREDVAQRLDVHAIVEAVRNAADMVAREQLSRLVRTEVAERRLDGACHGRSRVSGLV
jgi:hypothetical protein